jgi:hypothetical protein
MNQSNAGHALSQPSSTCRVMTFWTSHYWTHPRLDDEARNNEICIIRSDMNLGLIPRSPKATHNPPLYFFLDPKSYCSLPRLDAEARNNESVCLSPSPISIGDWNETPETRWNFDRANELCYVLNWLNLSPPLPQRGPDSPAALHLASWGPLGESP